MNRDRTIITVSMVVIGIAILGTQTQWVRKAVAYVTAFSHGSSSASAPSSSGTTKPFSGGGPR